MPDNGINWIQRFGKNPEDMDAGEWRIVEATLFSELLTCTKSFPKLKSDTNINKWAIGGIATLLAALWAFFSAHILSK